MAADFGVTGEVVVTSEKAEAAFDRVGDKATQMATEVAGAAGKAGQAVDGIGTSAEKSANKFTREQSRFRDAVIQSTQKLQELNKSASEVFEMRAARKGLDISQFAPYIEELKKAEAAQRIATGGLDKMGVSAAQTAAALRGVPAQFTDIIVSLQGGQAPLTVFLQQGGQLRDMFGGAGAAARALGGYVLGLVNPFTLAAVAVGGLGLAYAAGSKEADGYRQALVLTGNQAGATVGQMQQMAQQIAVVTGSQREAAAALATFASSGKVGQENLRQFTQAAIEFSRATGQSIDEVAKNFSDLANDPLKATLKLNESMNFLTESIFRQIQSLQEQGRETEAANVAQKAYADTLNERKDAIIRNLGSIEKAWAAIKKEAGYAMDAFLDIGRSKTLETRLEKAQAALASYQGTLPGKRTAEQVEAVREFGGEDGLKREIAGLQELIENQRKSAQMERERAAAVKASGELAQGALKYETDLEKQRREVLSATEKYETALKNQNLTQEQRNRLEADYINLVSGVTAVKEKSGRSSTTAAENKELRDQLRVFADLAGVSSTYYAELANYQKQRANGVITEQQYVQAVETLIQKQPFAVAAAKAHAEAIKDEAKAAAASAKTLSAWYEVRERESQGLQNQINARREDVMLMGMSAEAVAEYTQAKYEQLAAEKEAYAAALESASFYAGEYAEAYKAAAEAARQQAKQLRELGALEDEKVSKGAAKKAADEWQRTADQINQSLTDALMRGFESGKDFAANLRDTVVNMFKTMVLRPIVSAIVMPVAGAITGALGLAGSASAGQGGVLSTMGSAGGILSGVSAMGGALAAGAGWITGATTLGGALSAGGSLIAAGGAGVLPGMGMIAGALGPIALGLAGLVSVFGGMDRSGTPHYGAVAEYSGGAVTGTEEMFYTNAGVAGRYSQQAQPGINAVASSVGSLLDSVSSLFGGVGGFRVRTAYSDDSSEDPGFGSLRIERDGQKVVDWEDTRTSRWAARIFADGEEGWKMYLSAIAKDTRQALLDMDLPGWADKMLSDLGDSVTMEQLAAVVQQIGVINTAFEQLGHNMAMFSGITDELQGALLEAAGGIDALVNSAGAFYQGFYSEAERMESLRGQLNAALSGLDLSIDPNLGDDAKAQFRAAVESAMASGNAELAASLLAISGNFASAADYFEQLSKTAAEAAGKASEDARRSAIDLFRRAADRDRKDLQAQASSLSEAINGISSAVDLLKSNARDLYGEVDSTQQMLAAQGMVYIEDALAGVRAGASVADYTGLSDAISAARGGLSSGAYASEFERQRDALVLAGQLSELGELGDMQLSVEERQLQAINEQLEYLDALSKRAEEMVNGTTTLTETVDTYFARLMGILDPEQPEGDAGKSVAGGGATWGGSGAGGGNSSYVVKQLTSVVDPATGTRTYSDGSSQQMTPEELWAWQLMQKPGWIPSYDIGTNRVPRDMLAMVHKDEAIVPKAYNPWAGGQSMQGGDPELLAEMRAMRAELAALRAAASATATNTAAMPQMADQFDTVTNGGNAMRAKALA